MKASQSKNKIDRSGDLPNDLIDQILKYAHGHDAQAILGDSGLAGQLKRQMAERMLNAELTHQLADSAKPNYRNGSSKKTVVMGEGLSIPVSIPRDRLGAFEPQLIGKYQRRLPQFDERVIAMYARGMTTREIQAYLLELYGLEVSPSLISTITDEVMDEARAWQQRPLASTYAIVFFDAIQVKMRCDGIVSNQAVYVALGVGCDGHKEVLGLWFEPTEGAKFWLKVFNELRTRGVEDILIAVVDGLKGFPTAINAVYPQAMVQTCVVHLIRSSLTLINWKERKPLAQALKPIYTAINAEEAEAALMDFEEGGWGKKHPHIAQKWRRQWSEVIPFFGFTAQIRKMIYTTNAIESLNMQLRKATKTRGHFTSEDGALKLLYLAIRNIDKKRGKPSPAWSSAVGEFRIIFGDRFTA